MPKFKNAYHRCKWCGGNGCLQCDAELTKAIKAAGADKPIATYRWDSDDDMVKLKGDMKVLMEHGADAFTKHLREQQEETDA